MFCTNCGAEISDAARFCPKCGLPVQDRKMENMPSMVNGVGVNTKPVTAPKRDLIAGQALSGPRKFNGHIRVIAIIASVISFILSLVTAISDFADFPLFIPGAIMPLKALIYTTTGIMFLTLITSFLLSKTQKPSVISACLLALFDAITIELTMRFIGIPVYPVLDLEDILRAIVMSPGKDYPWIGWIGLFNWFIPFVIHFVIPVAALMLVLGVFLKTPKQKVFAKFSLVLFLISMILVLSALILDTLAHISNPYAFITNSAQNGIFYYGLLFMLVRPIVYFCNAMIAIGVLKTIPQRT